MSTNPNTRNSYYTIGYPDDVRGNGTEVLKISVDHKFIRYFIESEATIVFYGDYTLHGIGSDEDLAGQLTNILSKDSFLNRSFADVRICWSTDFEIIPVAFFDQGEMAAEATSLPVMNGDAYFIFEVPGSLRGILDNKFTYCQHYHSGYSLIELIQKNGLASADKLLINIRSGTVELVYFSDEHSLTLYNQFEYKAVEDYVYFILLAADEMKLDRAGTKVMLMGDISRDSKLYDMTLRYFMHVGFMPAPDGMSFSKAFEQFTRYSNYPLYNL